MTSATLPYGRSQPPAAERAPIPWWILGGAVVLVAACMPAFWMRTLLPGTTPADVGVVVGICYIGRTALNAYALWWASQRADLPPRLAQVLRAMARIGVASASMGIVQTGGMLGLPVLPVWFRTGWVVAVFGAFVATVFWFPRARRPGGWAPLITDILITLCGYGTLMVLLVTLPSLATASATNRWAVLANATIELLLLVGLNVLVMRGEMIPSRRAFWCLVAGFMAHLPSQVLSQLEFADLIPFGWSSVVYFLGTLPTLAAAYFMRTDPIPVVPDRPSAWLDTLNPIPLSAPLALGLFMLVAVSTGASERIVFLGVALAAATTLLVVRVWLTTRENARLVAAEHANALRLEREKMEAIGRLAGGIAHEFNNAMTVVMGCAELGRKEADDPAAVREDFTMIHDAAGRVVNLTSRLLAFSGRQVTTRRPRDLQADVLQRLASIRAALPPAIALVADQIEPVGMVPVDGHHLSFLCQQLIDNATEAMPDGGTISLSLRMQVLAVALPTPMRVLAPGRYVTFTVRDTGVGIPADLQRTVFEPFFSSRKVHEASGLGLAAVQGIAAAHDGGIVIDSAPGRGTAVTVYFPHDPPAP